MTDNLTQNQRRKNMQAIKSTSSIEAIFSKELWKRGLRFRRNVQSLYGKPDISIKKYKVVIFIDSCFWHQCPIHFIPPKSNIDYWERKINRNVSRDKEVTKHYQEIGWHVLRIWEHAIKEDLNMTVESTFQTIQTITTQKK